MRMLRLREVTGAACDYSLFSSRACTGPQVSISILSALLCSRLFLKSYVLIIQPGRCSCTNTQSIIKIRLLKIFCYGKFQTSKENLISIYQWFSTGDNFAATPPPKWTFDNVWRPCWLSQLKSVATDQKCN